MAPPQAPRLRDLRPEVLRSEVLRRGGPHLPPESPPSAAHLPPGLPPGPRPPLPLARRPRAPRAYRLHLLAPAPPHHQALSPPLQRPSPLPGLLRGRRRWIRYRGARAGKLRSPWPRPTPCSPSHPCTFSGGGGIRLRSSSSPPAVPRRIPGHVLCALRSRRASDESGSAPL